MPQVYNGKKKLINNSNNNNKNNNNNHNNNHNSKDNSNCQAVCYMYVYSGEQQHQINYPSGLYSDEKCL